MRLDIQKIINKESDENRKEGSKAQPKDSFEICVLWLLLLEL